MKVIVCGYGSIGKKYVELLKKKKIEILVFDPKLKKKDIKNINFFNNFKELKKTLNPSADKLLGIISSLSNNHLSNFKDLVNIGVNKILIEKPLTDKLHDYDQILNIRNKKKIFVSTHYKWEAEKLFKNILEIQKKYNMGKPFIFNCLAGSCCIATGAIHWIDFFSNFHNKGENLDISSNYNLDKINPRGKIFNQIAGNLHLKPIRSNISANFNFTNYSRLSPEISLVYKFHVIKFDIYGNYQIFRTSKKLDNLKITRYAQSSLIKKGKFKKKKNSLNVVLNNLIESNTPLISLEKSFYALKILFLSFISNKLKKTINLKKFKTIFYKKTNYNKNFRFT